MLLSSHKDLLSFLQTRQATFHLKAFAHAVSSAWGFLFWTLFDILHLSLKVTSSNRLPWPGHLGNGVPLYPISLFIFFPDLRQSELVCSLTFLISLLSVPQWRFLEGRNYLFEFHHCTPRYLSHSRHSVNISQKNKWVHDDDNSNIYWAHRTCQALFQALSHAFTYSHHRPVL